MEVFITHLWKSAILVTVFYCFYKFLLQKETYFKSIRYFLLSGIILSLIIPFITIIKHIEIAPIQGVLVSTTNNDPFPNSNSINWSSICIYIYGAIAFSLFVKFVFQLISIGALIYKNKCTKVDAYYFVETSSQISAFSFFSFIVYNPTQFDSDELKQVLAHEKAHVLQMHSLDNLISNLLVILLWFNPFAWLYKNKITQTLEFIADEYAQNASESQRSYQQLLLKTAIPNYQMALANNFYNSLIKKRIIMLHKQRSNSKSQWKFILMLPLLLVFVFTVNTQTIAQQKISTKKIVKRNVDVFAMTLNKESSKNDLKNISSTFLDKGLTVKFNNIKRNSNNDITAIKIDAKAKNGKAAASHASDLENGINSIQISYDRENNNLSIGSNSDHHLRSYSYSKKGKGNNFVFISDDDDKTTWVTKKGDQKIIIETDFDDDDHTEEEIKITTKSNGSNNKITISSNNDKEPLIILDGKEITKKEMDALDTDDIKSIDILKGAKAIEKYGKKAKDGVIIISKK